MLDLSNVNLVKYMSIPYIWGGSSFSGADCYGLVVLFYKEQFKLNIFDYKNLASQFEGDVSNSSAFSDNCEDEFVKIKEKDLKSGDIILFCNNSTTPNHIAIYLGNDKIVHMLDSRKGCCVSTLSVWKQKAYGYYRHKQLAKEES